MNTDQMLSKVQIYICNHDREDREACAQKGAKDLTQNLKSWAKENYPGEVKVYRSGCLGKCSEGMVLTCYPSKDFLLNVELKDEDDIKEKIKGLI